MGSLGTFLRPNLFGVARARAAGRRRRRLEVVIIDIRPLRLAAKLAGFTHRRFLILHDSGLEL